MTALVLEHALFNDGSIPPIQLDGQVSIIGNDAALTVSPTPVDTPEDLEFELVDTDENRDALVIETLQIRVGGDGQVELLQAVESGANTGIFRGSLPVAIGSAVSNNGIFETTPGEGLTLCSDDSLSAQDLTVERYIVAMVAAHDGKLSTTAVIEPGNTLRVQLIDEDLNADPGTIEIHELYAINATSSPDTEVVALTETSADDSVFIALLPTSATLPTSGDSVLSVAGGDSISLTYNDEHRMSEGPLTVLDTSFVVGLFGDADHNGLLQTLDAANVDSSAPEGAITPFDAALILQHRVGML